MAAKKAGGVGGAKQLNYEKIFRLFEDKHTRDLTERQVAVVNRVCKQNEAGFRMAELEPVCRLLTTVRDRLEAGATSFGHPLCTLVALCGKPFRRSKSNEERGAETAISAIFAFVGSVASDDSLSNALRLAAVGALTSIARGKADGGNADPSASAAASPSPSSSSSAAAENESVARVAAFNQRLLERTGVLEAAVQSFRATTERALPMNGAVGGGGGGGGAGGSLAATAQPAGGDESSDDDNGGGGGGAGMTLTATLTAEAPAAPSVAQERARRLLAALLELIRVLSVPPRNAAPLAGLGVLGAVVDVLGRADGFRDALVEPSMEVLWNVVENAEAYLRAGADTFARRETVAALRRHNPLEVTQVPRTYEVLARLLRDVLEAGYRQQDKELRNEILIVATVLASQEASFEHFRASGMLDVLLAYSTAPDAGVDLGGDVHVYGTTSEEDFELKQLLWGLVCALAVGDAASLAAVEQSAFFGTLLASLQDPPTLAQAWGATQLKALQLQALSVLTALAPRLPQLYGELGGNEAAVRFLQTASSANILGEATPDLELQHGALQLVLHTSGLLDFPDRLGDLGALDVMLAVFNDPGMPVVMRRDAVATISQVCRGHEQNQTKLRRAEGVEALRACLAFDKLDAVNNNFLIVAVADAVWNAVVGNRRSEARFLNADGLDALLDLLETCPDLMQKQLLGVLADLCRNPRAPPRFRVWKSRMPSMRTAAQLLLSLWLQEEARLEVSRLDRGLVNSVERPLGPCPPLTEAAIAKTDADAPEGAGGAAGASAPGPVGGNEASPAFARLKEALQAAKDMTPSERALREAVAPVDMRCKVYAVLQAVGFDEVSADLTEQEKLTFAVAESYPHFRLAEQLADVKAELRARNVNPIAADALLLERKIEAGFDCAMATKCKQQQILLAVGRESRAAETEFFDGILLQREQELQAQRLMQKASPNRGNAKKRKEAQKKKDEMVANSRVQ